MGFCLGLGLEVRFRVRVTATLSLVATSWLASSGLRDTEGTGARVSKGGY